MMRIEIFNPALGLSCFQFKLWSRLYFRRKTGKYFVYMLMKVILGLRRPVWPAKYAISELNNHCKTFLSEGIQLCFVSCVFLQGNAANFVSNRKSDRNSSAEIRLSLSRSSSEGSLALFVAWVGEHSRARFPSFPPISYVHSTTVQEMWTFSSLLRIWNRPLGTLVRAWRLTLRHRTRSKRHRLKTCLNANTMHIPRDRGCRSDNY